MSTVVQNENNDYDIDVAIVFDESTINDLGSQAIRNVVADALGRKTKQFNADPEVKTSCVRVRYSDGYHIDFAVYRCLVNEDGSRKDYEHAGSEWTTRELTGLTDWFKDRNDSTSGRLRKVVRLSKMFCKSRDSWKNMPSGLLQTVLCEEQLQLQYDRLDEVFYYTMKAIVNRLNTDLTVAAPVDNGRDLTPRQSDISKMSNWKNRLESQLSNLEVLFSNDCTEDDAIQAWYGFFNHEYWKQYSQESITNSQLLARKSEASSFNDTEQFIEEKFPVILRYTCSVKCIISKNGFQPLQIFEFLKLFWNHIPHHFSIDCEMTYTDCPEPYSIYWKVKNVGPEAERRNQIRGQIIKGGEKLHEHSDFFGNHYIECYIVKDDICVARKRINVPIGRE